MKLTELINTFKSMFYIFKISTLAIKTNNQDISKYKKLLKHITKHIFTIFITSFIIIYNELAKETTSKLTKKEDMIINILLSIFISIITSILILIIYTLSLIPLWINYLIWNKKLKKSEKHKNDEDVIINI